MRDDVCHTTTSTINDEAVRTLSDFCRCARTGPSVSFEYDPASNFFLRHYSAETFEGESCKLEKCFSLADGTATWLQPSFGKAQGSRFRWIQIMGGKLLSRKFYRTESASKHRYDKKRNCGIVTFCKKIQGIQFDKLLAFHNYIRPLTSLYLHTGPLLPYWATTSFTTNTAAKPTIVV